MTAYAALVSLFNNLDQIHNHPRFLPYFDLNQIQSLGSHVDFLLGFVERYNIDGGISKGTKELTRRIVSAAHEAEDIIESHVVDLILPQSAEISNVRLQEVLRDMESIKEMVLKFKEASRFNFLKPSNSMLAVVSSTSEHNGMVGFEEELKQLMESIIVPQSSRQIVSIDGMGGTGKTTLAKNVYEHSLTLHHFDLRAWATISQDYNVRNVLLQLLSVDEGTLDELREQLHKILFGRRYLIILDDVWSMEVLDIMNFFPDTFVGSRIIITTRLSDAAPVCIKMNILDENKSWNLFCRKVFGQEDCLVELEGIGKKFVEQCKGLPLSIVVIGGLLKKSHRTEEHRQSVAKDVSIIFNSEEYMGCLDVLCLSYSHLPAHLKPCFLYMGTFREGSEIRVSQIIRLWIAEGFLKPNGVQILEKMAENYLKDLVDRNLILVCTHRSNGKIRSFRVHDLLRRVCIKVAEKEGFFCVVRSYNTPRGLDRERRLILHHSTPRLCKNKVFKDLQSTSLARSLICNVDEAPLDKCKLLRVFNGVGPVDEMFTCVEFQNVNLRYVSCPLSMFPSSISLLRNLQTLVVIGANQPIVPFEIWKMTQLRHLQLNWVSPFDPPLSDVKDDSVVLDKLQALVHVMNFRLSEKACRRIPNVKKLSVGYDDDSLFDDQNFSRLQKL